MFGMIQARLTSSRLPGKVLKEIEGVSLLERMIERVEDASSIDETIVLVPDNKDNERLREFLKEKQIKFYSGSERNVLKRFYMAAREWNCKTIARMTADCPLIDPRLIDFIKKIYDEEKFDYVRTGLSYASGNGIEIFDYNCLEECYMNAKNEREKEHVTYYIKESNKFNWHTVENKKDDSIYRYTVDYEEDFQVVNEIVNYFEKQKKEKITAYFYEDIIEFLRENERVNKINEKFK